MRKIHSCLALLAVSLPGCLAPGPAPTVRWFAPLSQPVARREVAAPTILRRVAVRSEPHLGDRMLLRISDVEVFPDELHRWIAPPNQFAEQALLAALFDSGRCAEGVEGPELRVLVRAFEATLAPKPRAVVEFELAIERAGRLRRTSIRLAADLTDASPESIARGIGTALADAAEASAAWVVSRADG